MKIKSWLVVCLFLLGALPLFGQSSSFLLGDSRQGELKLISYGTYDLKKDNQRYISLRVQIKNIAKSDGSLARKSLLIGRKKEYFFDLKNGQRTYSARPKKVQVEALSPGQEYVFTLDFLVDAADPLANYELQYAPKVGPQITGQSLALKSFFANGPRDTEIMSRYGYFTLLDYYLGEEDKDKKRRLTLKIKLGNDRDYSSYFVTGFLPNAILTYGDRSYYFELGDGSKRVYKPIDIVPVKTNQRSGEQRGQSTEKELIPSDVRELTLNFILDSDINLDKLQLRYKDPNNYVDPSEWLSLSNYMRQVAPIPVRLKMRPSAEKPKS